MSISPAHIAQLKEFVKVLSQNPDILHDEKLAFFREYLTSLGATIPEKKKQDAPKATPEPESTSDDDLPDLEDNPTTQEEQQEEEEPEIEEPVDPTVIPAETDAPQPMGDLNAEVSDDNREKAQELRGRAQELVASELEEAVKVLTEAITKHNGSSAPLYATRGVCYLRLKKPASAIRDAEAAIKINPDSAPAYRVRGKAKALLGEWNNAVSDLKAANQRDYDPEINDALKAVTVKADEFNARQKKREERKKKAESKKEAPKFGGAGMGGFPGMGGGFPGMGGGMPGMGGGLGGIPPEFLAQVMQDPEVLSAMSDPEVMPILNDIMQNPAAAAKYQNHPKIGKLIAKFGAMFGK